MRRLHAEKDTEHIPSARPVWMFIPRQRGVHVAVLFPRFWATRLFEIEAWVWKST